MLALLGVARIPLLAYNFSILTLDPIWSQYTLQNETLSPAPVYYFWGYGLFWPPALLGSIRAMREREPVLLGALVRVVCAFLLTYAPFAIQRRFLLGITIPLSILAVTGVQGIVRRISEAGPQVSRRVPAILLAGVSLMSMTSIIFPPAYALCMRARLPEYFYPRSLDRAFAWIAQNTGQDDFLLGAEETGRLAAQKTGRRVYLGHPMETLHYDEKSREVSAYFRGELAGAWLRDQPIHWVIYGAYERGLSPTFLPGAGLDLAFDERKCRFSALEDSREGPLRG
jgi:hypothetical protein